MKKLDKHLKLRLKQLDEWIEVVKDDSMPFDSSSHALRSEIIKKLNAQRKKIITVQTKIQAIDFLNFK